jgi:hypothetical protein
MGNRPGKYIHCNPEGGTCGASSVFVDNDENLQYRRYQN